MKTLSYFVILGNNVFQKIAVCNFLRNQFPVLRHIKKGLSPALYYQELKGAKRIGILCATVKEAQELFQQFPEETTCVFLGTPNWYQKIRIKYPGQSSLGEMHEIVEGNGFITLQLSTEDRSLEEICFRVSEKLAEEIKFQNSAALNPVTSP